MDYLERVCTVNLRKLSFIMHQIRVYAQKTGLKPSFCYYKQWGVKKKNEQGHKPVIPLRFSKSGNLHRPARHHLARFVSLPCGCHVGLTKTH